MIFQTLLNPVNVQLSAAFLQPSAQHLIPKLCALVGAKRMPGHHMVCMGYDIVFWKHLKDPTRGGLQIPRH